MGVDHDHMAVIPSSLTRPNLNDWQRNGTVTLPRMGGPKEALYRVASDFGFPPREKLVAQSLKLDWFAQVVVHAGWGRLRKRKKSYANPVAAAVAA